ncbi:hypothetical protein X927_03245 [Petrotoga mexicana DSM 14811]|uniref:Uncharacterized protein n=1 Tax=Petrotoga mexicana DSM 14811 TaxID=1122954 RepID=A0A2K1PCM7_9BACT|nr:hypothetical protein X927_03245 [Petrotoga mexicana DSM 14811]
MGPLFIFFYLFPPAAPYGIFSLIGVALRIFRLELF